ncbi:cytochrome oxidase putative small subunit CydP [Undibacterium sp. TS12]|uniref:cytochrome oxidase putative small subunit CydP n=1 Tax=Undibacterium sp. TS12 TaxID=2908202 RepID=UPI001F4CD0B3|nr:cytochrome oxidase putative small subunit CydP [Undibacterium sp. TS12]MCH8618452.1 hypothetical protein [Undibacterium sp. TS12]
MTSLSAFRHWKRLPLWMEIVLVLIVKVAILTLLWHAFFSRPQTKHMRLPADRLEQHLLGAGSHSSLAGQRIEARKNQPELKDSHASH